MKTKKVVINSCFGGFRLSYLAIKEIAKRKGKDCFFFRYNFPGRTYTPLTLEEAEAEEEDNRLATIIAYSVPNPQDYKLNEPDENGLYKEANKRAREISLDDFRENREDKDLIAVVEELGAKASTRVSDINIVEIPADVEYVIEEYDGNETIAEKHRTWS